MVAEIKRLAEGIDETELKRLRARTKSALIMQQESSAARANALSGDWYHLGRVRTMEELNQLLDGLSCESVNDFLKRNPPQDFAVVTAWRTCPGAHLVKFEQHQLDNGLEIIAECNPQAYSMAVGFFVDAGSRDEVDEIAGVSHFLEHMTFKGTARRSAFDINSRNGRNRIAVERVYQRGTDGLLHGRGTGLPRPCCRPVDRYDAASAAGRRF